MNVLVVFHTPVNAGYAMAPLERTFYEVACELAEGGDVFFAFQKYNGEEVSSLPKGFNSVVELNPQGLDSKEYVKEKLDFLKEHKFDLALCFDLRPKGGLTDLLRRGGVKKVASYWGAPISGLNSGVKLFLKKMEIALARNKPELFIFESEAMRKLATHGRGILKSQTIVIPTGVDVHKLKPLERTSKPILDEFKISKDRKLAVYSGHMEERKGVHVLVNAFKHLVDQCGDKSWHLLICGNRPGEEDRFVEMLGASDAKNHVTFCGYRSDLPELMPQCDVGLIASTGWDSFPMSALEMAACGLPIIVSDLQGLIETVENEKTGLLFEVGDYQGLADILSGLSDDEKKLNSMSEAARERILNNYSIDIQKKRLKNALESIL